MSADAYKETFEREGELEQTPLPLLIAKLLDEKVTGTLHIEADGAKHWIYFEDGFPAGVHAPKSQDYLGVVLRELNFIDDAAFNMSLMEMAKTKQLQGQILLEAGAIDEPQLERGLSLQLARKLTRLFNYRQGAYKFVEGEELPPPNEAIRVNPYGLVYNSIKNSYDANDLKKGLSAIVGKSCRVSRLFVERGSLFEFPEDDLADAKLLHDFRLPQEFVRGARSGPTAAMMMLLSLWYCNMLELEDPEFASPMPGVRSARPAAPAPQPRPANPAQPAQPIPSAPSASPAGQSARMTPAEAKRAAALSNISQELRDKINDKFEQIKQADFYGILEVPADADFGRMQKAYLTLAKVYHPDRVAQAGDEELKHRMEVIFSKINEAYQTMTDSTARVKYDRQKEKAEATKDPGRGGTPRPEEAKIQFQKGLIYQKKRDIVKAAEAMRWACDMDPENGDYKAYRIYLDYERSEEPEEKKLSEAKADLQAVFKTYPESFWAARLLANLLKMTDARDAYGKALLRANRLDPKDHTTARDLRLFRAREEKKTKAGKFLGIKFKK